MGIRTGKRQSLCRISSAKRVSCRLWRPLTRIVALAVLCGAGAACATKIPKVATLSELLNERITNPFDDTQAVQVNFVSNRKVSGAPGCTDEHFTVDIDSVAHRGVCTVNVPRAHAVGSIDTTTDSPDRHAHFVTTGYRPMSEADYDAMLAGGSGDILLFVHGFNVKFQEAVFRAAQIAYDVKFQGSVLLFSWPAGPKSGFLAAFRMDATYEQNRERAGRSVPEMSKLLAKLAASKRRLYIVVHSMGHQVVIPAAAALADKGVKEGVEELVFTAPDFAQADFRLLSPKMRQIARRVTLYCSPADNALRVSEKVNGNRRVGQCTRIDGIDVINVSLIDSPVFWIGGLGHGYYSSRALLTDMFQLMLGMDVNKRLFVRKSHDVNGENYFLRN